jgi:hypothetical protein
MDEQHQTDAAARLLGRLRDFAMDLESDERELFAVLVGPGIQELTENDDDVTGFGATPVRWEPGSLRAQLASAVQDSEWQIVEPR